MLNARHSWLNSEYDHNKANASKLERLTDENIEECWGMWDECELQDFTEDFRCSGEETDLVPKNYSRHYESYDVAKMLNDGTWVGWTYWFGGGKHGEPSAVEWLPDSYDVTCAEEQKTVTVRTFAKVP